MMYQDRGVPMTMRKHPRATAMRRPQALMAAPETSSALSVTAIKDGSAMARPFLAALLVLLLGLPALVQLPGVKGRATG